MKIIINNSSMVPIYEQLAEQMKKMILNGEMQEDTALPSVRKLSCELKISALTVKKAYDALEGEGLVKTVHGKGTFVMGVNCNLLLEEQRREIEEALGDILRKGKLYGITVEELREMFEIFLQEGI